MNTWIKSFFILLLAVALHGCTSPDILEIKVTGSPLKLSKDQPKGTVTITNLSPSFYAYNIAPDLETAKLADKISISDNSCNQISPLKTCTITFKALIENMPATTLNLQGDNTDVVTMSIQVKTAATPTPTPSAPTLGSIAPTQGTSSGGTTVTLTGTDFTGTTSVTFDGVAATNVIVVDDTTVTADTPAHADGAVDVVITTANGSDTLAAAYTYTTAPSLTSISPTLGLSSGGTSVTLTGSSFTGATSVTFGGVTATNVIVLNDTTVTADTPAHAVGAVDVVITTPFGSDTLVAAYTYGVAPSLTSVAPTQGTSVGGTSVTLTGTNLSGTTSVTFGGVAATNVLVVNSTTVTVDTPAHAVGAVDVVLTTPYGTDTLIGGFTYVIPPSLTSVSSASGTASGNVGVTLTGTTLTGATSVTFGGISATSVNVVSATTVTAVTPAHAVGAVDVSITTPTGTSTLVNGYTYVATALGQSSAGGVIGCLGGGLQDLIAASVDNSAGIHWEGLGVTTNAQDSNDGATNTTTIVNALGAGTYAAATCNDFEIDSQGNTPCIVGNTCYNDWFLPATNQLSCLYNNNVDIGGFSTSSIYWASTEFSDTFATVIFFGDGSVSVTTKDGGMYRVRCARSFTP